MRTGPSCALGRSSMNTGGSRRPGFISRLLGNRSGAGQVSKAAAKNRKKNQRKKNRRLYRMVWNRFTRRMGRKKKRGDKGKARRWWQRWLITRLIGHTLRAAAQLAKAGRNTALFGVALAAITSAAWMNTAHRVGIRVRAVNAASLRALALPFEGMGVEVRRLVAAITGGLIPYIPPTTTPTVLAEPVSTITTPYTGELMSDGTAVTNLRPLIEAVREAGVLGGGEKPHAVVVHQWHRDATELMEVLAERLAADAGLAAETLPVSGSAHDITTSLASAVTSYANEFAEGTEAWEQANGTRLERLHNDEANKELWDHSTRPDA